MEKEKLEIGHQYKMEIKQNEMENQLGADWVASMAKEYIRSPAGRAQVKSAGNKNRHK